MTTFSLEKELKENSYPGRGIVIGRSADGKHAVTAYFIMGRSENSRNRVFVEDGEGIRTQAFDPSKLSDPSLIIYAPVRVLGNKTIVTNGDQTDTIRDFLEKGKTMEEGLRTRKFEHDGPNWTPRISGLLSPDGSYKMSILKSSDAEGTGCNRYTFDFDPIAGLGHFLHTYVCDGNPVIPTFQGEPERVEIPQDMDAFVNTLWNNLNEDNKISLFVRYTDLATGEYRQKVINRYE